MAKKSVENKEILELGSKQRAGGLLSSYLRGIGTEKTETVIDPITCKTVIVSKAEALARKLWDRAIGRRIRENPDTGELEVTEGDMDLDCAKILLDRIEGKTGVSVEAADSGKATAADKVSEINKRRMNALAEGGGE